MSAVVTRTAPGTKTYPLHKHRHYEIMLYLSGEGSMRTQEKSYPFSPGTIIIMPPGVVHGSSSDEGFENISVCDGFEHLFCFDKPCVLHDSDSGEGRALATLIYENRYSSGEYLAALCSAYALFLVQSIQKENTVARAVSELVSQITERAYGHDLSLSDLLASSGYAEDYIRACFKQITGMTPGAFLAKVRIDRACSLIDIYGGVMPLEQIAERCGYLDYVYFSKKFKRLTGFSPSKYRDRV
ncbi:MAG: helix-turn-helix domain-containing protein [Clostridia bacterium]|nr:helix-turn-helix domain-containing protein [Clostridia bacterium]